MLKNGAVYYIHLYFPYILISVVSHMTQEGFPRVGDYPYLQIWQNIRAGVWQHHLWTDYRSCSKDGYYKPRGSKYQICLEKGCTETNRYCMTGCYAPRIDFWSRRFTAFWGSPVNHPVPNFHHVKTDSTIPPADQTHNFQKVKEFLMLG